MPTVEPLMMVGDRAIIQEMLAEKMELNIQLLQGNRREVIAPMDEPMLNEGQHEEGSYSQAVEQY